MHTALTITYTLFFFHLSYEKCFEIAVGHEFIVLYMKTFISHIYTYQNIQVSQVTFPYSPHIYNMKMQLYSNSQTFFSTYSFTAFHLPFICPI